MSGAVGGELRAPIVLFKLRPGQAVRASISGTFKFRFGRSSVLVVQQSYAEPLSRRVGERVRALPRFLELRPNFIQAEGVLEMRFCCRWCVGVLLETKHTSNGEFLEQLKYLPEP